MTSRLLGEAVVRYLEDRISVVFPITQPNMTFLVMGLHHKAPVEFLGTFRGVPDAIWAYKVAALEVARIHAFHHVTGKS